MRTSEEYKKLSIQEFTKAAQRYDSDNAGIYDMCKEDYPPILAENPRGAVRYSARCRVRNDTVYIW